MPTEPVEPPGRGSMLDRARVGLDQLVRRTGVALSAVGAKSGDLGGYAVSFAIAFLAGLLAAWVRLPLPWMLGPLFVALVFAINSRPLSQPKSLVLPTRAVIGVAIGATFTPDVLAKASGTMVSLALMVPYMVVMTYLGTVFLVKCARFDKATAFFSAAPGGLADMLIFGQDAGADLRRVALVQSSRLLAILAVLPFWMQFVDGLPLGGAMPRTLHLNELLLVDAVTIVALAWGGWWLAGRLGMMGGSVVGPMLLSGIAHVLALTTAKVPVELLIVAQILIGISVGSQFKGISMRELVTVLSWGLAFSLMLVVAAVIMAFSVARLTGLDQTSLLLSYAPGGQNEMALIALILGLDAAIIALHHLVRVVMVVMGAQFVFKAHPEWRQDGK